MGKVSGCCFGMMIGIFLVLATVGVGVYFWLNPEAKDECVECISRTWDKLKGNVDDGIEHLK